jgi:hypothetical protein
MTFSFGFALNHQPKKFVASLKMGNTICLSL